MNIYKKICYILPYLISFPYTIYFNFRYFPFKQAWKFPVWLCKPRISGHGKYLIEGEIKTGMIRLGYPFISIYRRKGVVLENKGKIIFKGKTRLGADSAFSVGEYGELKIGNNFMSTYGLKIVCYDEINIGDRVRTGWDILICDTDLHSLTSEDERSHTKGFGKIRIGNEVWIASFCKLYKNTEIPDRCTIAANTLINKKIECEPYSLIYSGGGIKIKKTGFYRNIDDDKIDYSKK